MKAGPGFILLLVLVTAGAGAYYALSTAPARDLVLVGLVDGNQVVVSPQVGGRIEALKVQEGDVVKAGELLASLDPAELQAERRALQAALASARFKVAESQSQEAATAGGTAGDLTNAEARLASVRAQLAQAEAALVRVESSSRRILALAQARIASDQDRIQAEADLKAQQAVVSALGAQVEAAAAEVAATRARTHQADAAHQTVSAAREQASLARAQLREAEVHLGYTRILAPLSGTVSVLAAREGEVLAAGSPLLTLIDPKDTWVRAAIPETEGEAIALGDELRIRLPGGTVTRGRVFFKAVEADFATQRDVSRRKRDIRTLALKVRLDNPTGAYVPGMTAEILLAPADLHPERRPQGKP